MAGPRNRSKIFFLATAAADPQEIHVQEFPAQDVPTPYPPATNTQDRLSAFYQDKLIGPHATGEAAIPIKPAGNTIDLTGKNPNSEYGATEGVPVSWNRAASGSVEINVAAPPGVPITLTESAGRHSDGTVHVSTRQTWNPNPQTGISINAGESGASVAKNTGLQINTERDFGVDGYLTDRTTTRQIIPTQFPENGIVDANSTRTEHFEGGKLETSQFHSYSRGAFRNDKGLVNSTHTIDIDQKFDSKGLVSSTARNEDISVASDGSASTLKTRTTDRNADGTYTIIESDYTKLDGKVLFEVHRNMIAADSDGKNILSGTGSKTNTAIAPANSVPISTAITTVPFNMGRIGLTFRLS